MVFCNSCGRPIVKEDYGTNKDGSLNSDYCIDCYQNGEFTEPDITLSEMITRKTLEMMEKIRDCLKHKQPVLQPWLFQVLKDGIQSFKMIIKLFNLHFLK